MTAHNTRYGWRHRRERARWKSAVEAGRVVCWRCDQKIEPWHPWDLGHIDGGGPHEYAGPEHRRCSRATVSHAWQQTRITSREW